MDNGDNIGNKPAFPRPFSHLQDSGLLYQVADQEGMTLLEYYAGQALLGLVTSPPHITVGMEGISVTERAWRIAEDMIAKHPQAPNSN